jgi:hypothetical protein
MVQVLRSYILAGFTVDYSVSQELLNLLAHPLSTATHYYIWSLAIVRLGRNLNALGR